MSRPLLALGGIGVQVEPGNAIFGCNQVSADALGREKCFIGNLWVRCPSATIRHHRHARHGFDTTADGDI